MRGVPARSIMAEMYGKIEGCSGGRGGSMHLFDAARRFYGGNAIVAGGLPVAVGLALAEKMQDRDGVVACFFGEGAIAEGEFHECMNLAALWQLPILFCCENNLYAMGTALRALRVGDGPRRSRRRATRCPRGRSTAWTSSPCATRRRRAVDAVRNGGGPHFLELRTYRFRAALDVRPRALPREDRGRAVEGARPDPGVRRTRPRSTQAEIDAIEADAKAEIDDAVAFAEQGTDEPVEDLTRFVTSELGRT